MSAGRGKGIMGSQQGGRVYGVTHRLKLLERRCKAASSNKSEPKLTSLSSCMDIPGLKKFLHSFWRELNGSGELRYAVINLFTFFF